MKKYALKQLVRLAVFTVGAIWFAMLGCVALIALVVASGAAGDPGQPKAIWVCFGATALMFGNGYLLSKVWEWK